MRIETPEHYPAAIEETRRLESAPQSSAGFARRQELIAAMQSMNSTLPPTRIADPDGPNPEIVNPDSRLMEFAFWFYLLTPARPSGDRL